MWVLGLVPTAKWLGNETMCRTIFIVPATIVVNNLHINGVDGFHQSGSTSATVQRKRQVTMSLLIFILDASVINAYALLNSITKHSSVIIGMEELKGNFVMQLIQEHVEYK